MHLTICYFDGRRVEALALALSANQMRISIPEADDTIELSLRQGVWMTEDQEPVEIESLVSATDLSSFFSQLELEQYAVARAVS